MDNGYDMRLPDGSGEELPEPRSEPRPLLWSGGESPAPKTEAEADANTDADADADTDEADDETDEIDETMHKQQLLNRYIHLFNGEIENKVYELFANGSAQDLQSHICRRVYDTIYSTYQSLLERDPTDEEVKTLFFKMNSEALDRRTLALSLYRSPEYKTTAHYRKLHANDVGEGFVSINSFVDGVFVINLDRRPERMTSVTARLEARGIRFERFAAVDGKDETVIAELKHVLRDNYERMTPLQMRIMSPGAYGCLRSHLQILKTAKERGLKKVLILEDDVMLHKDFDAEVQRIRTVPGDWEIIYLGASQTGPIAPMTDYFGVYRAKVTYGGFAYIVRDTMYDTLIQGLEERVQTVDYLLVALQPHRKFYVLHPNVMIADLSYSDTGLQKKEDKIVNPRRTIEGMARGAGWDLTKYA